MTAAGQPLARAWSLRTLLVTSLLLFSVLPAAVVGWFLYDSNLQIAHLLASTTIDNVGQRIRAETEAHLAQAHTVLNGLVDAQPAALAAVRARQLIQKPVLFEQAAFALTRMTLDVPRMSLGGIHGEHLGVETLLQDGRQVVHIDERKAGSADQQRYLAATPGDRRHLLPGYLANYDARNTPWYQTAIVTRQRAFTAVSIAADARQLELALAQPVFAADGAPLGVLAVGLPLERLGAILQGTQISSRAIAFLVDEQGLLVASSTGEPLASADSGQLLRRQPQQSSNPVLRLAYTEAAPNFEKMRDTSAQAMTSLRRMPQERGALLVALLPFGEGLGVRWSLVVAAPESDFTTGAEAALRRALQAAFGILLLGAALSVALAWRLSRHFGRLSAVAARLAMAEIQPLQASRIAEVQQLSSVLHHSAAQLQRYRLDTAEQALALQAANETLEERVVLRTAELSASRDDALEAARAKAAFLATMSHEIRTPLNGVVGMATLMAETPLSPEQRDYLQTMRVSSDQLLAVINDILDFSKFESGRLELENELLNLQATVEEACDIGASHAREKGLALRIDLVNGLPAWVRGDVTRLRQVLLNLVNNAIKFTDHGQVVVSVRLQEAGGLDGHGALVEFRVQDTGIGIAPAQQSTLFQSFVQVDASTTRQYGGTGLGLAICRQLVKLMGGQIGLESVPGKGSTFWFTARLAAASPLDTDSLSPLQMGSLATRPAAARNQRILVVDDNAINLKVALAMLAKLGYPADTAVNGRIAADRVAASLRAPTGPDNASQQYAAILMDANMPVMDGLDATRLIIASHGAAAPPVIALTASVLEEDRQRCLHAGMVGFLPKPLRIDELAEALAIHARQSIGYSAIKILANNEMGRAETAQNIAEKTAVLMDWGRLEQFREFDDDERSMTREVVSLFTAEMPQRVADIWRALASGNSAALSRTAHALKGAASNVGAQALSLGCGVLEQSCLQDRWPADANAQVADIARNAEVSCAALRDWANRAEQEAKQSSPG